jgi:hypothetical protein
MSIEVNFKFANRADLISFLQSIQSQETLMALQDIKDKIAALQTAVANETTVEQSAVTLLQGLSATIASLKQQLADAIANGASPADLQAVSDGLDGLSASVASSTNDLAAAVTANTPAE